MGTFCRCYAALEDTMAVLDRFQDPGYVNWVKAGQALLCTAEGIYDFCEGPIRQYHQDLHKKFPWRHCRVNCRYVKGNCLMTPLCVCVCVCACVRACVRLWCVWCVWCVCVWHSYMQRPVHLSFGRVKTNVDG